MRKLLLKVNILLIFVIVLFANTFTMAASLEGLVDNNSFNGHFMTVKSASFRWWRFNCCYD